MGRLRGWRTSENPVSGRPRTPYETEPATDEIDLEDFLEDNRPVFFDEDDYDFQK